MNNMIIKKPDVELLKKQSEALLKMITPGDDVYLSPDEVEILHGLVNFCENVADRAEGVELLEGDKLHFAVEGRNGYYAVDRYMNPEGDKFSGSEGIVEAFKTKKLATSVCYQLNGLAYDLNKARGLVE